jgi:hypothetical protein
MDSTMIELARGDADISDNDGIADPACRQALGAAIGAMRATVHDEYKLLEALREGAAALEPFNDPTALEHLALMATDRFGIGADLALGLIKQGCDLAVARRVERAEKPSACKANGADTAPEGVTIDDLFSYMPMHRYIFAPTGDMWPASSVNARIGPIEVGTDEKGNPKYKSASAWLDENRHVEQMTWAPGLPMLIRDRLIAEGGWIERNGVMTFNLYRSPTLKHGDAAKAEPWIDHLRKVFGDDADHIIRWLAHRVQRPHEKINHALVLGGSQGIGKDTLLEPVKHAVGPWTFCEVSPQQGLGRFNGFVKSVILRISEARDLGDVDRFKFYDHMKAFTAAPPDVLRVDEKNLREHSVVNVTGVIITTNHKSDGIFLPADDRRHFVAWSELTKEDFTPQYWNDLWDWYHRGGNGHVAAYLASLDLVGFDPKAPPPKTAAFSAIVDANRAPEDAELADVLDNLGNPDVVTINRIAAEAPAGFQAWILDRKNRRQIPHRMERCGYGPFRNDGAKDGMWKINGQRQVVYAKDVLPIRERFAAVDELMGAGR